MNKKYSGVVVPLLTPLNSEGNIDSLSVKKLINHTINASAIPFVLGTTGEIFYNSQRNRLKLVSDAVEFINNKTILYAGISDNCIDNSIEIAKKYAELGVDVLVAHLPSILPLTDDLILEYFKTLADKCPAPIMIYNVVSITHMSIPINIIEKLSQHDNIVGLKDSERDFERIQKLAELFNEREDFSLFIGWTGKSVEALEMGFDGIIPNTANVVPKLFQSLYEAAVNGNSELASEFQFKADELGALVQANKSMTQTIPELKALMKHLNICQEFVSPPLETLSNKKSQLLVQKFNKLDLQ
jgi:4-hydroxy-tetrahydrodipicolinate synthase